VINNLFADSIGHRIKKLVKKPDAAPTILFFETTNKEVSAEENLAVNLKLSQNEYKKR
jgi:hypothetical protein